MIKTFKEYRSLILEGGNIEFDGQAAERIDLQKFSRDDLVPKLKKALITINKEFKDFSGEALWNKATLDSGRYLSGSAFHFFNVENIPTPVFTKYKPSIGDIDTQVDGEKIQEIESFLEHIQGKPLQNDSLTLIGSKKSMGQFITLWSFKPDKKNSMNIQIDLELVDYHSDTKTPTDWANFSHSSNWNDMTKKIKGVFHKWLLRALSDKDALKFVERMKTKDKVVSSNIYSFSVAKGLRSKYVPVLNKEGQQETSGEEGLLVYRAISTKDSVYETGLDIIFKILFGKEPKGKDLELFESYGGLLTLIKRYLEPGQQENVINRFVNLLFEEGAQGMYKGNPEQDREEKELALGLLLKTFNKPLDLYKEKVDAYYKNYK